MDKKLVDALSRRNPYPEIIAEAKSQSHKERNKLKKMGYDLAVETLRDMLGDNEAETVQNSKLFMATAYGLRCKEINEYHIRIYHDEYRWYFDWYYTTGTLMACTGNGTIKIGKEKDPEAVALAVIKHVHKED